MAALPYIGFHRLLGVAVELCGGLQAGMLRGNRMEERVKGRTKIAEGFPSASPRHCCFCCLKLWRLRCGLQRTTYFICCVFTATRINVSAAAHACGPAP